MREEWILSYWRTVLKQDETAMMQYFDENAQIFWHNTNEAFTAAEFITVNCAYPGEWDGMVERCEMIPGGYMTITHVTGEGMSFHVTSLLSCRKNKIIKIDEYWSEDGRRPKWRENLHLGTQITSELR